MSTDKIPAILRGAAALHEMMDLIGGTSDTMGTDHQMAKIFVDNEENIDALLTYVLGEMAGIT